MAGAAQSQQTHAPHEMAPPPAASQLPRRWEGLLELNLRHLDTPSPDLPTLGLRETTPTGWLWGQSRAGIAFRPLPWLQLFATQMYDDANGFMRDHTGVGLDVGHWRVKVGTLMPASGHPGLPAWALPSLFVQTVLGHEHWSDEGVTLDWHGDEAGFHIGHFTGSGYRGGTGTVRHPGMWEVGGQWGGDSFALSVHGAHIEGIHRQVDRNAPHTHGPATAGCGTTTNCLAGSTALMGMLVRWGDEGDGPWVATALDWRREQGTLESTLGKLNYRGDIAATAAEVGWGWPQGGMALRMEELGIVHRIGGANATAVAYLLRIDRGNFNPGRQGLRLAWRPSPRQTLALEGWRERGDTPSHRVLGQWQLRLGTRQSHHHGGALPP
ncbi:MAG: hypothetical protein COX57_10955 [Alphaproteobacteria bacterium CG_4_10_14_0_2_um_filter_63_37]|nr:MAG: hypothetical protein AUJ55_09370 [Proteobacteria bacterium CG1_02_64_396]PJA23965.1 MAG: hypothetical protein COX57_10955 [Alphaproteobacteria bacterium CG_4_10_14_0_2_um_filter_63_37]